MKHLIKIITIIYQDRKLLFDLAQNDFKAKFASSLLGTIWAFVQPMFTIVVFWFVFQMGFKSTPVDNMPYILWFVPAFVPWLFFSDIMNFSAYCMQEYNYLVKKVRFDVEILPVVKVVSALFVHIFFVGFIVVMYLVYGEALSLYCLQAVYYSTALLFLGVGISFLISSVTVLFKDFIQVVSILLQVGFWAIPIFWNPDNMEPWVVTVLKLNPMYYIVSGYRESFIYHIGFWEHPVYTTYFWGVAVTVFAAGGLLFSRLRPHFADEL
jgi:teichoic acid transport system permease protein